MGGTYRRIFVDRFDTTDPDRPLVLLQEGFSEGSEYRLTLHGYPNHPTLDVEKPLVEEGMVVGFQMVSHLQTCRDAENMEKHRLRDTPANMVQVWEPADA